MPHRVQIPRIHCEIRWQGNAAAISRLASSNTVHAAGAYVGCFREQGNRQMVITLPDYPDLLANVGSACRMANLFDEAAALLNRSLHLNLARAESWNNRGQGQEDLGEFAEAYTCYQNAYSLNQIGRASC